MRTFLRLFGRELGGYFAFPLAYLVLVLIGVFGTLHFAPGNSPFQPGFGVLENSVGRIFLRPAPEKTEADRILAAGESRGEQARLEAEAQLRKARGLEGLGRVLATLTLYLVCALPALCIFLLVVLRCYADDSLPPETTAVAGASETAVVLARLPGTFLVACLAWGPALAIAAARGWLRNFPWQPLLVEILVVAGAVAIARVLLTRGFRSLFSREVKATFYSPIAYVVICFMLIATGYDFYQVVVMLNHQATELTVVGQFFNGPFFWIPLLLSFPLITMRSYADEFRMGTFEIVATAPVRDWEVVGAKYCGALFFFCLLWLPSASYFMIFHVYTGAQAALAPGAYLGSYLMLLLTGMFFIAVGCLTSCLTSQQINAAVMCFILIFTWFAGGHLLNLQSLSNPNTSELFSYFWMNNHMIEFSRGIIDTRPFVLYLSLTTLLLFANFHVFLFRKWKA